MEKNILEQIRESAESVEVPESLKPEQMEKRLAGKKQKKRQLPVYRMGAVAAAVLLFVAGWSIKRIPMQPEGQEEHAVKEIGSETIKDSHTEVSEKKEILPVRSEKELYTLLYQNKQEEMYVMEDAMEAAADTAVEESAMDLGAKADYSETNVQEMGVDEGDIIKTDGDYIYSLVGKHIYITEAKEGVLKKVSELTFAGDSIREMYVADDILNVIVEEEESSVEETNEDIYTPFWKNYTCVYTYDISDRANPIRTGKIRQEGYYQTSRKNGEELYLFTQYYPEIRDTMEKSQYLPEMNEEILSVEDIYVPKQISQTDYLVVSSVNMTEPGEIQDRKAIVSGAAMFYVSQDHIYICNTSYQGSERTQIMKFQYEEGKILPEAVGSVPGYLNDTFSMNEKDGYLRLVVTEWTESETENHLFVLDEDLEICGSITDLAPGEIIQSARFLGDSGYFVTFRQMDPLFSVDLSNPREPKLLGELKITGFSSYLHFYGENKLLGVGYEVEPETGEYQGIKLSMFDLTDPANVTEQDKYVLTDKNSCEGIYNYKAILADPVKNIIGMVCDEEYFVFSYQEETGFREEFRWGSQTEDDYFFDMRGLYIGDVFYLSDRKGIRSFDQKNEFVQIGEVKFKKNRSQE